MSHCDEAKFIEAARRDYPGSPEADIATLLHLIQLASDAKRAATDPQARDLLHSALNDAVRALAIVARPALREAVIAAEIRRETR